MKKLTLILFLVCMLVIISYNGNIESAKTTKKVTTKKVTTKKVTTKKTTAKLTTAKSTVKTTTQRLTKQQRLNLGVLNIIRRNANRTRLPRNRTKNRGESGRNMRQTSDIARNISDIAQFVFDIATESNSRSLSSLEVSSFYCPYARLNCDSTYKYRSYDGYCNNLKTPYYGTANTPYKRIFTPDYDDGVNSPRTLSVSGNELPNVRKISVAISPPPSGQVLEQNITHLYAIFGQFLTHDITGTSAITDDNGDELECPCTSTDESCFAVDWPSNDSYLSQTCMSFTRSSPAFPDFNCSITYREQLNLLSSYIDGSALYGINVDRAYELRTLEDGLLTTSPGVSVASQGITGKPYIRLSTEICTNSSALHQCFLAGEYRTSENLALVSMHTLFNREHNRIVSLLANQSPTWSDEKLYQETRRIVIAQFQHIVFNEWLPLINGNTTLAPLSTNSYYTGYNSNINPQLNNEFATAAFRFGHSLIRDKSGQYNVNQTRFGNYELESVVFKSDLAFNTKTQGLNSIFNGLFNDMCWKFGTFGNQLQNRLFGKTVNGKYTAYDLLATNIQRGRDHGLQPYAKYVKYCHNISVTSFNDLKNLIRSNDLATLQLLYEDVNDIDLYVGGLLEKKISNFTIVGPTFGCLIMEQFSDLKNGDRFYYENAPTSTYKAFSLEQLAQIKKVTLAGLICNNYDLTSIQPKPFFNVDSSTNPRVDCSTLKNQVDLTKWVNEV